jgi:hypothetical protein
MCTAASTIQPLLAQLAFLAGLCLQLDHPATFYCASFQLISAGSIFTISPVLWWMMQARRLWATVPVVLLALAPTGATAGPPAQKLPSAFLALPHIQSDGYVDTRIELVNLTNDTQQLNCFFVTEGVGTYCREIGFLVYMTPYQPLSWLASWGLNDTTSGTAAPPFFGTGDLLCAVVPPIADVEAYNTVQGRATVFAQNGETASFGAVGFQRLQGGDYDGVIRLDGFTYAQCPAELHFQVLTDRPGLTSDLVLVPCSQNLVSQSVTSTVVQFLITNEFEQSFSTSTSVDCYGQWALSDFSDFFTQAKLATDTAQLSVRGVNGAVLGLVIDRVSTNGTAGNEPSLAGGRSAVVNLPHEAE